MISNIEKYKDRFFRNYKEARSKYCLRYTRPQSFIKRSRNALNAKILEQTQLVKLLFYFFYKKKTVDTKNLFFFSRCNEYIFFLKKLYFNVKHKQT